uniref:Uncharacterized protein n=1 Tax=Tanacetum cinerariifolium TaxID=118510 RepID=A0A6L2P556_TANCI|nr:hypothetical protein [Tanacetum cinerariifolium]
MPAGIRGTGTWGVGRNVWKCSGEVRVYRKWDRDDGNDSLSLEKKSSSASKRRLEKVVKSSQTGTSHSHSSSDSLGIGTRFSTLDFMNSSDSVSEIVLRCSSPILRESSGSTEHAMDNCKYNEHHSHKTHKCIDDKRNRPTDLHTYNNNDGQSVELHLVSHVDKHYHQSFDCSAVTAHRQAGLIVNIHNHSENCFHISKTSIYCNGIVEVD